MSRGGLKINVYSDEEREIEASEKLSPIVSQFAKSLISQHVKHLETPKKFADRVEWANNKMWDFSEGKIASDELNMVRHYLTGWMDLGSDHEKNSYKQIYQHITSLLSENNKEAKSKEFNVVDQARSRNAESFMQQLTSLMVNKPRYATVDDAVKDMQERTGLNIHLENVKSAKKKVNKEASYQIPESLQKYDFADDVAAYIRNNIQNTGATGASIAAIEHDLLSVFPKLDPSDIMNDEVAKFISDCIYSEQSQLSPEVNAPNLGKGVGKDLLVQDTDPWAGLMPSK